MPALFDNLLFVVFLQTPSDLKAADLWSQVLGSSPDNFNSTPNGTQAMSVVEGMNVAIGVTPPRIDVAISPLDAGARPGYFESPDAAIAKGIEVALKIAERSRVERFAVVFQTTDERPDAEQATQKVADLIGLPSLPDGAEEVVFSVTVGMPSKVLPGTRIQRLVKWFSARKIFVGIPANFAGIIQGNQNVPAVFGAAGYADVFNAVGVIVPPAAYKAAISELADEARQILSSDYHALT